MNDEQRRAELAQFLRIRRERLSPAQVHLPERKGRRRTPGLRREELAQVAGVGLTWYTKLEQGQDIQVSAQVLESLSQALQLTSAERTHLFVLAREHLPLPAQTYAQGLSEDQQHILNALQPNPAYIANDRWDIVGWNQAASQVFGYSSALSSWERNQLWLLFTDPRQRKLFDDQWEGIAQRMLALFRARAARYAGDPWFSERRDRLMQVSPEFRAWWSRYDIAEAHIGRKNLKHPVVGSLVLQSTTLLLADDSGLKILLYTPLPEEDTAKKLATLASLETGVLIEQR
ncbi:MAG TPA: helix-turn-helix transcriptional regulator [Ktedonosporobacter sp.]|nr:helix-turn-helix transcriptional regulator [Ktedonosporobacter sp.]